MLRSSHELFLSQPYVSHSLTEMTNGEKQYGSPLDLTRWTCLHTFHAVGATSHVTRTVIAICRIDGIVDRVVAQVVRLPESPVVIY